MTKELHYRRSLCCSPLHALCKDCLQCSQISVEKEVLLKQILDMFDFPPFLRKLSKLRIIHLSPLSPNLLCDNGVIFPNMGNGTQVIPGRIVH